MSANDYFSIPTSSGSEKNKTSKEPLSFYARHSGFRRAADKTHNGGSPGPPNHNGAKKSYRASFPQSKREKKERDAHHGKEERLPRSSSGLSSPEMPLPPRCRRSAMHHAKLPLDYHAEITSTKRVHFNDTVVTYNPINAQETPMIDQIFAFMGVQNPVRAMQSQTIPQMASYSVAARPIDEVPEHRAPSPLARPRELSKTETSLNAELVDGTSTRTRTHTHTRTPQDESARKQEIKTWLDSRPSQHHKVHFEHEYECNDDIHSSHIPPDVCRSGSQATIRAEKANKRHSMSHYETHSQRRAADARSSESRTRPRGNTIPATVKLDRAMNATRGKGRKDTSWLPADEVLKKPEVHRMDSSRPVADAPDDSLHRSDAQRLPSVPLRQKLLRNIPRMWGKGCTEADASVPTPA